MTQHTHHSKATRPLDPTARDFDALLAELRQRVRQHFAPQQLDLSETGLLGMLLDLFAAVGDGLHFQLDNALHELFWDTVRDRDAAARLATLVGYRPKGATAAVVTLRFTPQGDCWPMPSDQSSAVGTSSNTPRTHTSQGFPRGAAVKIPARTPVATADGDIVFETLQDAQLLPTQPYVDVPAEHAHAQEEFPDNTGQPEQVIVAHHLPCVEGNVHLHVQDTPWQQVEDFLASGPTDSHYRVRVDAQGRLHVYTGDGLHGRIPVGSLRLRYRTGGGTQGNVPAGCLHQLEQALYDTTGVQVPCSVTNPHPATGGAPPESVRQIRRNALLHLRSQQRAVTEQDIVQHAQAVPGVGRVKLVTRVHNPAVPPHTGFLYITAAQTPPQTHIHKQDKKKQPQNDILQHKQPQQHQLAADTALLQQVQQRFTQEVPLPVGFVLHVVPASWVPLDLAWHVWLHTDASLNSVRKALCQALQRWLSPNSQQPWGQLPHVSALLHQAHQAHASIQGVKLLTDLSHLQIKPHQLPVLGTCTVALASHQQQTK